MSDELPSDPTPDALRPTAAPSGKELKGWVQRRAEAMLRKPGRASAALSEPGQCQVVLQLVGPKPIHVIAVIRSATGLDLLSASALAKDAPAVVVSGISEASADRVVEQLQKAGARAVAGASYQP